MRTASIFLIGLLMSCTQFPELDAAVSASAKDAPYPSLISLDEIVAEKQKPTITPATVQGLENRVSRLRAKAARLSGPVIDAATRARMARGVRRG